MHAELLNILPQPLAMKRPWKRGLQAALIWVLVFTCCAAAAAGAMGLVFWPLGVVVAGFLVAWSLPRFDRFVAPGPELMREEHPRLFKEIDRVASLSDDRSPWQVYLVGEAHAFVSERGGFLGLGGRRVIGLGLPLLNLLSVSELRAILAHKFGHAAGGDARTLREGLKKVERAAEAYPAFMQSELGPLLAKGLLPPVGEGFRQFLTSQAPLGGGLAVAPSPASPAGDARLSIELVRNISAMEVALAQRWMGGPQPLQAINWEQTSTPSIG